MNKTTKVSVVILLFSIFVIIGSCEKKKVPAISTAEVTNITGTTATSGGTITDEGSGSVISRGICWSTGIEPTISDSKTSDGTGAGTFTSNITGLNGATTYNVRAFATNSVGTGYGTAMSFTTLGQVPTTTNSAVTDITTTGATLNGTVNANFLSTIVTFEYGTSTDYGQTATASQSPVTGNTTANVSANITGLTS